MANQIDIFKGAYNKAEEMAALLKEEKYVDAMDCFSGFADAVEKIASTEIFKGKYAIKFNHWIDMLVSHMSGRKGKLAEQVLTQNIMPMVQDMLLEAIIIEGTPQFTNVDDMDALTEEVQAQYKEYMYPNRWKGIVPKEYTQSLKEASVTLLFNLQYIQYMCQKNPKKLSDVKVLMAGCGTGEDALGCARIYPKVSFTFVDISPSSIALAKYYGEELGIKNVEYRLDNILTMDLGEQYDFIISSGVIHHLSEPEKGVENLKRHLMDDGVMSIMVYGEYGRFEIGLFQETMKTMKKDSSDFGEAIDAAKELLGKAANQSRLRNIAWKQDVFKGNQHIVDLLLNVNENRYNVKSLSQMMEIGGMRIVEFLHFGDYDPLSYLDTPMMREAVQDMNLIEKAHLGELINGRMSKHEYYAVKKENEFSRFTTKTKGWMDLTPMLSEFCVQEQRTIGVGKKIRKVYNLNRIESERWRAGYKEVSMDKTAQKVFDAINGKDSVRAILKKLKIDENNTDVKVFFEQMLDNRLLHLRKYR